MQNRLWMRLCIIVYKLGRALLWREPKSPMELASALPRRVFHVSRQNTEWPRTALSHFLSVWKWFWLPGSFLNVLELRTGNNSLYSGYEAWKAFPTQSMPAFFVLLGTNMSHASLAWLLGLVLTCFLPWPHDLYREKLIFVSWTPDSGYASGKIITCLHPLFLYSITVGFHPLGF